MKRYWAAAVLAAFIVFSIGIYYVQATTDRLPQFRLATLEGDGKEAAELTLQAQLARPPYGETVAISSKGSQYDSERTLPERLRDHSYSYFWGSDMEKLIREYPNFMRGKYDLDYQDDDILANVDLRPESVMNSAIRYRFDIELLDKKTNEVRSFEAALPGSSASRGAGVLDVQRIGSKLKIAVKYDASLPNGRRAAPEIHVYDVNTQNGQMTDDGSVGYGLEPAENQEIRVDTAMESNRMRPADVLILDVSLMNVTESKAESQNGLNAAVAAKVFDVRQLVLYDYATGRTSTISLPEDDPESQEDIYADGKYVLWIRKSTETVNFKRYRLEDSTLENEGKLTKQDLRTDSIGQLTVGENRIYMLCKTGGHPSVAAVNPADGKIVYRGSVTLDDPDDGFKQVMLSALEIFQIQYRG